jgi:hypothetical protein
MVERHGFNPRPPSFFPNIEKIVNDISLEAHETSLWDEGFGGPSPLIPHVQEELIEANVVF